MYETPIHPQGGLKSGSIALVVLVVLLVALVAAGAIWYFTTQTKGGSNTSTTTAPPAVTSTIPDSKPENTTGELKALEDAQKDLDQIDSDNQALGKEIEQATQ